MKTLAAVFALALVQSTAYPHGDHSVPGTTPPGLHGGAVKEAGHAHSEEGHSEHGHDDEKKEEEKSLFFEVVFEKAGKKVKIYPLILETPSSVLFTAVPMTSVKIASVKVRDPRKGKVSSGEVRASKDSFEIDVAEAPASRMIVQIEADHDGERKVAEVQVETKK
ncbi:hypothetical protein K2X33_03600 [bacterium]|nr:hypothetical protein [bacterium]